MPRRERLTLLLDTLQALRDAGEAHEDSLTRVASRSNVPYDRFREILDELVARGLVTVERPHRLTEKGAGILDKYRAWLAELRSVGVDVGPA